MKFGAILIKCVCVVVWCSLGTEAENILKSKIVMPVAIFKLKEKTRFPRIIPYAKPTVRAEITTLTPVTLCSESLLPGKVAAVAPYTGWGGGWAGLLFPGHIWVCGLTSSERFAYGECARCTGARLLLGAHNRGRITAEWQPTGWKCRQRYLQRAYSKWVLPPLNALLGHYVKSECPSIHGHRTPRPQRCPRTFIKNNPQFPLY